MLLFTFEILTLDNGRRLGVYEVEALFEQSLATVDFLTPA